MITFLPCTANYHPTHIDTTQNNTLIDESTPIKNIKSIDLDWMDQKGIDFRVKSVSNFDAYLMAIG